MPTRLTSVLLTGTLGLGGLAAGVVVAPAVALAQTSDTSTADAVGDRVSRIAEALSGLVSGGTITQEQADAVASTLAESLPPHGGHGGPGRGLGPALDTAAETLGVTVEELRGALADGSSLADVAAEQGVERQALVDALVAAAVAHVDEHLADGDITPEQADGRTAEVAERVEEMVDREGLPRHGRGPRGGGPQSAEDGPA